MENLIQKAKKDPQAFTELYRAHVAMTYRYAFSRLQNHAETEDIISQTWETILMNIGYLRSDHPIVFKAWIFKILKTTIQKHLKVQKKYQVPLEEYADHIVEDEATLPSNLARKEENKKQLQKIIRTLPSKQQEVVRLRFAADLKNYEIAKIMRISEKTVASNLYRALRTLEKSLKNLQ